MKKKYIKPEIEAHTIHLAMTVMSPSTGGGGTPEYTPSTPDAGDGGETPPNPDDE